MTIETNETLRAIARDLHGQVDPDTIETVIHAYETRAAQDLRAEGYDEGYQVGLKEGEEFADRDADTERQDWVESLDTLHEQVAAIIDEVWDSIDGDAEPFTEDDRATVNDTLRNIILEHRP